jgi:hypothetical protein
VPGVLVLRTEPKSLPGIRTGQCGAPFPDRLSLAQAKAAEFLLLDFLQSYEQLCHRDFEPERQISMRRRRRSDIQPCHRTQINVPDDPRSR